jgi:riboflavin kinase/FMN adenylyltransferase
MSSILHFESLHSAALPPGPLHLAIGMFDGVHLGHRAVIEAAVQSARRSGGVAVVLTFWPHPSTIFRPEHATRLITPTAQKVTLLAGLGVQAVITHPFSAAFSAIEAVDFLPYLRQRLPALAAVYVGENWRFGRGRTGDIALLLAEGRRLGLHVFSAPRVNLDGEPVSSTRVRAWLEAGEIAAANAALGYTYVVEGPVIPGKQLGQKLGFPTLNLAWDPELRPRFGVYVVRVSGLKRAGPLPGIANYGVRPTVESATRPQLEAHLLVACPFGPGDIIKVEWLRFIRPEMKFPDVAALRAQIARDIVASRG